MFHLVTLTVPTFARRRLGELAAGQAGREKRAVMLLSHLTAHVWERPRDTHPHIFVLFELIRYMIR
jgi:hypothetical protein